ncbi:MAG: type II toxin-antitoxin system VapC family toxin [Fibrobacteres bacterium]|nr:type II toxin-antitoxin system VapC family toxin [Fibrobacterota bacterium]
MKSLCLIDTDIVIDFLRGNAHAISLLKKCSASACFSCITVAEIYAGVESGEEEKDVVRLFSMFQVYPITEKIAKTAGLMVKKFGKSHSVEIPDALIAATCTVYNLSLLTLNVKHYPMIKNLDSPYRKS